MPNIYNSEIKLCTQGKNDKKKEQVIQKVIW